MKRQIDLALTSIQQGERDGLATLYEQSNRVVFAFILPLINDYQLAEDIMQDTYVKVYQSIASYTKGTNGLSWLLTIAKNMALTLLERQKREEKVDFDASYERAGAIIEHPNLDHPTIDLAKRLLPNDEQQIVFLYVIGEYKHREIAELLNLPIGTVTWKYQQAMKKLRDYYKKGGTLNEST